MSAGRLLSFSWALWEANMSFYFSVSGLVEYWRCSSWLFFRRGSLDTGDLNTKLIMEGKSECFSKSLQCLWPAPVLITAVQLSLRLFGHFSYTGHDKLFLFHCLRFGYFEGLKNYQLAIIWFYSWEQASVCGIPSSCHRLSNDAIYQVARWNPCIKDHYQMHPRYRKDWRYSALDVYGTGWDNDKPTFQSWGNNFFQSYFHRARFIDWDHWHVNRSHIPQGPIVFKTRDEVSRIHSFLKCS